MGTTARTFTISLRDTGQSQLAYFASQLAPGQSVEFNSDATNTWCNNSNEPVVYWNHKFHWDEINKEAQIIGIGTGFANFRHAWYMDATNEWGYGPSFDPVSLWPVTNLGHPYQWHTMTPDGTYWVKRSTEKSFQYRKRSDRASGAWSGASKTPDYVGTFTSWPEALDYHHAMDKAILRYGATVMAIDLAGHVGVGSWGYETLPIAPSITRSGDKCAMHYCHALQSMIFFGVNDGATQDSQYILRADGSFEQMTGGKPPRYVMNGNITLTSTDTERYCLFVDDPLKQSAYLLERQPASSTLPNRVWKMNNTGTAWDGTWTEIGTTDVFKKPRADRKSIGTRPAVCAITTYGVVWVLRQVDVTRCDSFLWRPPA